MGEVDAASPPLYRGPCTTIIRRRRRRHNNNNNNNNNNSNNDFNSDNRRHHHHIDNKYSGVGVYNKSSGAINIAAPESRINMIINTAAQQTYRRRSLQYYKNKYYGAINIFSSESSRNNDIIFICSALYCLGL